MNSNGHEYRFAYSLFAVSGTINGVIDALSDDFTAKFFISNIVNIAMFLWTIYEMLVMDSPRKPFLASFLLIALGLSGYIGFWHSSWLITWVLFRGGIPNPLWLAPNIYVDLITYNLIAFSLLAVYMVYGFLINVSEKAKQIYVPRVKRKRGKGKWM